MIHFRLTKIASEAYATEHQMKRLSVRSALVVKVYPLDLPCREQFYEFDILL